MLNEHVTTDTAVQAFAVIVSVAAVLWAILALARAEEHLLGTNAFGDLALGDDVR